MTILCGTDFTSGGQRSVTAAAHLARALETSVRLVHVLDIPGAEEVLAAHVDARVTAFFEQEKARLETLLRAEARRVESVGAPIDVEVIAGTADEAIVKLAAKLDAEIVAVAAVGKRAGKLWSLGSTADRIAQTSHSPVLIVRDEEPFRAWNAGERALRIVAGADFTPTSDAALRWLATLLARRKCTVVVAHVFWPPEMRERLGHAGHTAGESDAEIARTLESQMKERTSSMLLDASIVVRAVGGLGRPADHLAQVATEESGDVLVVGTHQRTGLGRFWHGSTSHDAIMRAPMNVVVVPRVV